MLRSPTPAVATLFAAVVLTLATVGCNRGSSEPVAEPTTGAAGVAAAVASPVDTQHPVVLVSTSLGDITLRLDAEHAPLTVANFLRYVDQGYYNGTIFHQVVDGFVAVGGNYNADLAERPAEAPVRNEADNGVTNRRGTIAMARQAEVIDSASSQFFLNLADNKALDHRGRTPADYGYCVFGDVTAGQEVMDALAKVPVRDAPNFEKLPAATVAIREVRRLR